MASIHDVAREANVSVTTVSRVMNNRGYISEATRKKVFAVMDQLNYRPNEVARSLFRKKSNVIGVIIPDVSFSFFAEYVRYVEEEAYANGYKVMICNALDDGQKEREYIRMLRSSQVDGIILGSHTMDIHEFENLQLPVVTLDRTVPGVTCVTSDNDAGGRIATQALLDRGCQHIAHIRGPIELETPANRRSDAFAEVAGASGVKHTILETSNNEFVFNAYLKLVEKMFQEHPSIDGVFASNDLLALAVLRVAKMIGKHVPEQLQIIGFDGVHEATVSTPQMATISQDIPLMAKESVQQLLSIISEESTEAIKIVLPVQFIHGETILPK